MKILISGAGVAGLALALQLDPTKFDVTIIERAPEFRNQGFSITLWSSGMQILRNITDGRINASFTPVESFDFHVGDPLQKARSLKTDGTCCTIRRQDLMDVLSSEVVQRNNIVVRFNEEVLSVKQEHSSAVATFKTAASETYDLVVIAEGANSALRDRYFETKQTTEPFFVRYQWIKSSKKLKHVAICGLIPQTCYFVQTVGDYSALGYYTSGDKDVESLILKSINNIDWIKDADIKLDPKTRHEFSIKTISSHSGFHDRLVLIGDAYHAHSPSIGYGTSLALEDSTAIASMLNEKDISSTEMLLKELHAYEKERSSRASAVYSLQDLMEKLGISDNRMYLNLIAEILKLGGGSLEMWLHKLVGYSVAGHDKSLDIS